MKKIKILISAGFLFSGVVLADDGLQKNESSTVVAERNVKTPKKTTEQKATSITDALNQAVNLSKDVYDKVYQLNLDYLKQKEQLKASGLTNTEEINDKMKEISVNRKKEIAKLLTEDQKVKWKAWKQSKKEERKANGIKEPMFDEVSDM